MSKVRLNLASGQVQERELITAFKCNDVKYIIFDGESIGSMGLPIILVSKEMLGRCIGITDAEEWKTTKECLKKIIAGEPIEYARVDSELKSDDVYYRQLTLPIASFDLLKSSYKEPEEAKPIASESEDIPVFDALNSVGTVEPVTPVETATEVPIFGDYNGVNQTGDFNQQPASVPVENDAQNIEPQPVSNNNYDAIKAEFMKVAEEFFDKIYNMINHQD